MIEVGRRETRLFIKDIVDQLVELDSSEDGDSMKFLCMPWYYKANNLETDSETRANILVNESEKCLNDKLTAMEQRLDRKNQEMFDSIKNMLDKFGQPGSTPAVLSYAGAAAAGQVAASQSRSFVPISGGQGGASGTVGQQGGVQNHVGHQGGVHSYGGVNFRGSGGLQPPRSAPRGRSPSIKRAKMDDGSVLELPQVRSNSSQRRSNPKKAVVGTSTGVIGRKMRSPPADIFIYGVHPDTSE